MCLAVCVCRGMQATRHDARTFCPTFESSVCPRPPKSNPSPLPVYSCCCVCVRLWMFYPRSHSVCVNSMLAAVPSIPCLRSGLCMACMRLCVRLFLEHAVTSLTRSAFASERRVSSSPLSSFLSYVCIRGQKDMCLRHTQTPGQALTGPKGWQGSRRDKGLLRGFR